MAEEISFINQHTRTIPGFDRNIERHADEKVGSICLLEDLVDYLENDEKCDRPSIVELASFCLSEDCDEVLRDLIFRKFPEVSSLALKYKVEEKLKMLRNK